MVFSVVRLDVMIVFWLSRCIGCGGVVGVLIIVLLCVVVVVVRGVISIVLGRLV